MTDCLAPLQEVDARRSTCPDDHQIGLRGDHRATTPTRGKFKEVGWRTFYLFAPRRGDGRLHHRRDRRAGPAAGLGQYYVALTFSPAGRRPLRGGHGRERQPPLRDHPRRRRSTPRPSSRRRSAAAARASRWAPATPRSSSTTRASSSSCCARARSPRPSRRATSRSSARRSARDSIREGVKGMLVGIRPRPRLHGLLLPEVGRRRRRGGALQPDPADGGPRDASAPR